MDILLDHFTRNGILDDAQFGFRSGRSVSDQLLLAYNLVTKRYDDGLIPDFVLLDFSKAFDKVSHSVLFEKLYLLGIRGRLLDWIKDFLTGRKFRVVVDDGHSKAFSTWRNVTSGVPQGSLLGPILFLVFINFLCHDIRSTAFMFADDLKLIGTSMDGSQTTNLQVDLDTISARASSWGLPFNVAKCSVMRFSRRKTDNLALPPPAYHLESQRIQPCETAKDLGVIVDNGLKFHAHVDKACRNSNGKAHELTNGTVCRTPAFMKELLVTYVRPIMEFGSVVWNTGYAGDVRRLEAVQRAFTKKIHGYQNLTYSERLEKLDLFSVEGRLLRCDLIQTWKILHGLSPIKPEALFQPQKRQTRGHALKVFKERANTDIRKRFFTCRVTNEWNSLPPDVTESHSLEAFKAKLAAHLGARLFHHCDSL